MGLKKLNRSCNWIAVFAIVIFALVFTANCEAADDKTNQAAQDEKAEEQKAEKKESSEADEKKVVAKVNGENITSDALERDLLVIRKRFERSGRELKEDQLPNVKKEVLENLINRVLLKQESEKQGIKIEPAKIEEQLGEMKKRYDNPAEFEENLKQAKITEAGLKEQIRLGLAIQQLIQQKFVQNTTISDKEAKAYYEENRARFSQPEQVKASHILIKADKDADETQKDEARKKIEKIQKRVEKGEDFASLAKELSEGPSASKGGDLGFFGHGSMVKPFETAAFSLNPDEISDVVETQFGYHLIKVTDKKPAKQVTYEEVQDKLKQFLKQQKVKKEVDA